MSHFVLGSVSIWPTLLLDAAPLPWPVASAQRSTAPPSTDFPWVLALLVAILLLALLATLTWRHVNRTPARVDSPVMPSAPPQPSRQLELPTETDELADLLAAAAPRLRQPLHALSLYTGSLSENAQPAQLGALHGMQNSVRELNDVVNEIDHLLQWLAQPTDTDADMAPLSHVLAAIRPGLDALAMQYDVRLRWRRSKGCGQPVPQASTYLLRALVANAIRSAATRVLVTHRSHSESPGIQVHDDGPRFSTATPIPLTQLLQQSWPSGQRDPGLSVAAGVAARTGARVLASSTHSGNLLEAMLPPAPAPMPLTQATALSLVLLESEARNGRRTGSRLASAPDQTIASSSQPDTRDKHL